MQKILSLLNKISGTFIAIGLKLITMSINKLDLNGMRKDGQNAKRVFRFRYAIK